MKFETEFRGHVFSRINDFEVLDPCDSKEDRQAKTLLLNVVTLAIHDLRDPDLKIQNDAKEYFYNDTFKNHCELLFNATEESEIEELRKRFFEEGAAKRIEKLRYSARNRAKPKRKREV